MKKIILIILLTFPFYIQAQNRLSIGLKFNFHTDDSHFKNSNWQDGRFIAEDFYGFEIGPLARYRLSEPISIQSGINLGITGITSKLNLNYKGNSGSPVSLQMGGTTGYIKIPAMLMYKLNLDNDSAFSVTFMGGGNLYLSTKGYTELMSDNVVDQYDSIVYKAKYYNNSAGISWGWAAGVLLENRLPSGNSIALNVEFRIGHNDLGYNQVNYSIYDKDYSALLATSGPRVSMGVIYYWGLNHPKKEQTKANF